VAKQWGKDTGQLVRTFYGIDAPYATYCLAVSDEYLFAGTQQTDIRIIQWKIADGSIIKYFSGILMIT
jgi:hypothetical protein